jgi:HEAT repeat protein
MPVASTRSFLWMLLVVLLALPIASGQKQEGAESLIQKLSDSDPTVRGEALRALEAMPTSLVVPKVLDALKTADKDSAERLVKVLVQHPDVSEIDPLIALAMKFDGLGSEVFTVLGADGARGLLGAVPENCDANIGVKNFLVWAGETASTGGAAARAILKEQTTATEPCTRKAALYGIAAVDDEANPNSAVLKQASKIIVSRLADSDLEVADTAAELLKPRGYDGRRYREFMEDYAAEHLIAFVNEQKDPYVRARALVVLAGYDDEKTQELMHRLADDSDPTIREIAASYAPPQYEEDRIHYSESPESGITPPEKAAEIDRLSNSKNPADRISAAEQMGKSGDVLYTADLIELLKDSNSRVRAKAAEGLGELNGYFEDAAVRWNGNRADSAPALYAALDDASTNVRAAAVKSLASLFPDHSSTDEIPADHGQVLQKLKSLSNDKNPAVAKQASLAYANFLLPEDIKPAIELLKSADPDIRRAASGAIVQSQSPLGVKPLLELLKDPDKSVRCDTGRSLWVMIILAKDENRPALSAELTAQPLADALQDPVITRNQIFDLLAASTDPVATAFFLKALDDVKDYSPESAIRVIVNSKRSDAAQILLAILRSGNYYGGIQCLQALIALKDPAVEEPILAFAKTQQGAWINQDQVLLAFRDVRLVEILLNRLKDRDEHARAAAANELSEYRDERIVPALIKTLRDEAWAVQYSAAASLGKLGDPRATSALIAMLDYDPGAAALALGDLHRVEALPKLTALLANPKVSNRNEIVTGIAKMPDSPAAEALASFVEHNDNLDCELATAVARALANLHDPRVIRALQKINLDGCQGARTAAAQSLSARGARAFAEGKEPSRVQ